MGHRDYMNSKNLELIENSLETLANTHLRMLPLLAVLTGNIEDARAALVMADRLRDIHRERAGKIRGRYGEKV